MFDPRPSQAIDIKAGILAASLLKTWLYGISARMAGLVSVDVTACNNSIDLQLYLYASTQNRHVRGGCQSL